MAGPNPVDRGKSGSKVHVLADQNGPPSTLAASVANLHDSQPLEPLVQDMASGEAHADKAYDLPDCHHALRERGIDDRIARRGIESSARLGRHCWAVDGTVAWLEGLPPPELAITCYRQLADGAYPFEKLYIDIEDTEAAVTGENVAETAKPLIGWWEQAGAMPGRSQAGGHKKNPETPWGAQGSTRTGVVEVLHSYANPNPQLDAALDRLAEPAKSWIPSSGPTWQPRPDCGPVPYDAPAMSPRPLNRRLPLGECEAIVIAYSDGVPQKDLAVQYGVSDRSVKRLIANARKSGLQLRTRAV